MFCCFLRTLCSFFTCYFLINLSIQHFSWFWLILLSVVTQSNFRHIILTSSFSSLCFSMYSLLFLHICFPERKQHFNKENVKYWEESWWFVSSVLPFTYFCSKKRGSYKKMALSAFLRREQLLSNKRRWVVVPFLSDRIIAAQQSWVIFIVFISWCVSNVFR